MQKLRTRSLWSKDQVWSSHERHGTLSSIMNAWIDWLPLSKGDVRPTHRRTLAVMQVSGGSQSSNAGNAIRLLGRWMRIILKQSSVPNAFELSNEAGRLSARPHGERLVDVCEELVRFMLLIRDNAETLVDCHSERIERSGKEAAAKSIAAAHAA